MRRIFLILLSFFIIYFAFTDILKASEDNFEVGVLFGFYTSNGPYLEIKTSENSAVRGSFFYIKSNNDEKSYYEVKTSIILEIYKERLTEFYTIFSSMYSKIPTLTENDCAESENCGDNIYNFFGGGVGAGFKFKYFKAPIIICEFHLNLLKDIDENRFFILPTVVLGIGFDF